MINCVDNVLNPSFDIYVHFVCREVIEIECRCVLESCFECRNVFQNGRRCIDMARRHLFKLCILDDKFCRHTFRNGDIRYILAIAKLDSKSSWVKHGNILPLN